MYLCKDTERRNMNRKTIITLIVCALAATGVAAQEERPELVFEPAVWDFGSVREADGPVRHTFTGGNRVRSNRKSIQALRLAIHLPPSADGGYSPSAKRL